MKNLNSRLRNIEKAIQENDIQVPPDFTKWSDSDLDMYIKSQLEKFHKEDNVNCFEDAEQVLQPELDKELITRETYNLLIKGEKEFWEAKQ